MQYLVKTPWWLKKMFPSYEWEIPVNKKIVYLTFDDGPHPLATNFVLDQLKLYEAHATFFCIGKNVVNHADIYKKILEAGHRVGNHTQHHLNGWKTKDDIYLHDIAEASKHIDSDLFRPPYGRIKSFQSKNLSHCLHVEKPRIIMWSVLSADFDTTISKEQCLHNVILNVAPGSIVVFHDSEKAFPLMEYALPRTLKFLKEKGYEFGKL